MNAGRRAPITIPAGKTISRFFVPRRALFFTSTTGRGKRSIRCGARTATFRQSPAITSEIILWFSPVGRRVGRTTLAVLRQRYDCELGFGKRYSRPRNLRRKRCRSGNFSLVERHLVFLKRRGSQIFEDTFGAVQCGTLAGRLKNGKMSALSGE